ncbi:hypothetical protein PIROE2DRAFT_15957 [Piromyces sp. E2]|nr:hypothetical protein PIROE2DRAFT_15957 [Piromyces sp. E2]|eukprot:OUM58692.1 hypothetical protein PIROE2DRAFT_15957 [Piromyces sp. E2]
MCQEASKRIVIMTIDDGGDTSAFQSISEIVIKYGIDATNVKIPKGGVSDQQLHDVLYDSTGNPKYKALVFPNGRISFNNGGQWKSAITDSQWETIYEYSRTYGSRVVFLNEYPSIYTGTKIPEDLINSNNVNVYTSQQTITAAPGSQYADIINTANLNTYNIYHFPAIIENTQNVTAQPLLYFEPNSSYGEKTVAAVEVDYAGAKFSAYHMAFGQWSKTSKTLNILWISWATELDLKTLSSSEITTEEALKENSINASPSSPSLSDAGRNRKLEMLFVTLSTLFSIFYFF